MNLGALAHLAAEPHVLGLGSAMGHALLGLHLRVVAQHGHLHLHLQLHLHLHLHLHLLLLQLGSIGVGLCLRLGPLVKLLLCGLLHELLLREQGGLACELLMRDQRGRLLSELLLCE